MSPEDRLKAALDLLAGLRPLQGITDELGGIEFAKAWALALERARKAAVEYVETS
jgi:hypothetical protein